MRRRNSSRTRCTVRSLIPAAPRCPCSKGPPPSTPESIAAPLVRAPEAAPKPHAPEPARSVNRSDRQPPWGACRPPRAALLGACPASNSRPGDTRRSLYSSQHGQETRQGVVNLRNRSERPACVGKNSPRRFEENPANRIANAATWATGGVQQAVPPARTAAVTPAPRYHLQIESVAGTPADRSPPATNFRRLSSHASSPRPGPATLVYRLFPDDELELSSR